MSYDTLEDMRATRIAWESYYIKNNDQASMKRDSYDNNEHEL